VGALAIRIYIVVFDPVDPDLEIREMVGLNERLGKAGVHSVINPLERRRREPTNSTH